MSDFFHIEMLPIQDEISKDLINKLRKELGVWQDELNSEEKQALAKQTWDRFTYLWNQNASYFSKCEVVKNAYYNDIDYTVPTGVEKPVGQSGVKSNLVAKNIDAFVGMVAGKFLQNDNKLVVFKDPLTGMRNYKLENWFTTYFHNRDVGIEMYKLAMNTALFQPGILKILPDYEKGEPKIETINNQDIAFESDSPQEVRDALCCVQRIWLTPETVKALSEGDNPIFDPSEVKRLLHDIKKKILPGAFHKIENRASSLYIEEVYKEKPTMLTPLDVDPKGSQAFLAKPSSMGYQESIDKEEFGRYMLIEYHDQENYIIVAEEKYLLCARKRPFEIPYYTAYFRPPLVGDLHAKSIGERLLPYANEDAVKANQRIDNINAILNANILLDDPMPSPETIHKLRFNEREVIPLMGGIASVHSMASDIPDVTMKLQEERQVLAQGAAEITAVNNMIMGEAAKQTRMTKDESNTLYQQSLYQFDFFTSMFIKTALIPIINGIRKMLLYMYDHPSVKPMAPPTQSGIGEPEPLGAEDLQKDYLIEVHLNPTKEARDQNKAMQVYQMVAQHPNVNQVELLRYVFSLVDPDAPPSIIAEQPTGDMMPQMQGGGPGAGGQI